MRRTLDGLYKISAGLAAACLLAILVLVALQVGARLLDRILLALGSPALGFIVPSLAEIAGFLLAAATFLALADTLARNVHIRVNLLTERLPERARNSLEGVVAVLGAAIAGYAAFAMAEYAYKSFSYNDVSYGFVAVPLALPQAVVALGLGVLAIALLDEAACTLSGRTRIQGQESGI